MWDVHIEPSSFLYTANTGSEAGNVVDRCLPSAHSFAGSSVDAAAGLLPQRRGEFERQHQHEGRENSRGGA